MIDKTIEESDKFNQLLKERIKSSNDPYNRELEDQLGDQLYQEMFGALNPAIVQIKGKQNLAPKEEYLPFVQDFVRNSPLGDGWGRVGDISNTGLVEHMGKYITKEELARRAAQMRASGDQI